MSTPTNQIPPLLLYPDWRDKLEMLSDAQRGKLFLALFYHLEGKPLPAGMNSGTKVAFSFIMSRVEAGQERYRDVCRRNLEKRSSAGERKKPPAGTGTGGSDTAVGCSGNAAASSARHPDPNPKPKPNPKPNPKSPARAPGGSFDVEEFFEKALSKSYGKPDGTDPSAR